MKSILTLSIVFFAFGLIIATGARTEQLPLFAPEAEAPEPVTEEADDLPKPQVAEIGVRTNKFDIPNRFLGCDGFCGQWASTY